MKAISKEIGTRLGRPAIIAGSLIFGAALFGAASSSALAGNDMVKVDLEATSLNLGSVGKHEAAVVRIAGPEGYSISHHFGAGAPISVDLLAPSAIDFSDNGGVPSTTLKGDPLMPDGRYRYEVIFIADDGSRQVGNGSFFVRDGVAFRKASAAGFPKPPINAGLGPVSGGKDAGKAMLKIFNVDDTLQIQDTVGDNETRLFWGSDGFDNWRLDNRSGDLTAESFPGAIHMVLASDGDLGLGTTTPVDDLNIVEASTPAIRLQDDTGEEDWQFVSGGASTLQFDYEGTLGNSDDVLTLAHTGNVGIGAGLDPTAPLHVRRSDGSSQILVQETSSNTAAALLKLENNGFPLFRFQDTNQNLTWDFRLTSQGDGGFSATRVGSGVLEFRFENDGDLFLTGQVNASSSRSKKDHITPVSDSTLLEKVAQLPISEWSYKDALEDRHLGPMAEDFHALFGLGPDNKHISPNDMAGVALAAVKALKEENDRLKKKIAEMENVHQRLKALEAKMAH